MITQVVIYEGLVRIDSVDVDQALSYVPVPDSSLGQRTVPVPHDFVVGLFHPMVRDDQEGGVVEGACSIHGGDYLADSAVSVDDRLTRQFTMRPARVPSTISHRETAPTQCR